MEPYQAIQNRAAETAAVIKQFVPAMSIGTLTAAGLASQSQALDALAQARDDALAAYDAAASRENRGFQTIRKMVLALPKMAEGELEQSIPAQADLLDRVAVVFSVDPRTTELALKRGKKVVSSLTQVNAYLKELTPPRGPITSGGIGVAELSAAMDAQTVLVQTLEDRSADVSAARAALRNAATDLDQLNKRFYRKLQSEARSDDTLAAALAQITTESPNLPGTLGIRSLLQGGAENRQVLVNYVSGTYQDSAKNSLEWRLERLDSKGGAFDESVVVDPGGNAIGPFASGETVHLRTRVSNGSGTTTGSVRTLKIS